VLDLALTDQVFHRARDVLDGHIGIDAVLVEQVDHLDSQPLQRFFGHLPDAFGATVETVRTARAGGTKVVPKLGGDDDVFLERLQRLAHDLFVGEGAVDLGGVEEGDAAIDRRPDQRDHLGAVGRRAIARAHPHAAEPDRGDFEPALAECAFLHGANSCWARTRYIAGVAPS